MRNLTPLGALGAIVVIGVTIEVVEGQSRAAAYALVVLVLLGIITFNAAAFSAEVNRIVALLNQRPQQKRKPRQPPQSRGSGGASFR